MCITIRKWLAEEGNEHLRYMARLKKARDIKQWLSSGNGVLSAMLEGSIKEYYKCIGVEVELR